jgi:hypothetical protein
MLIVGHGRVPLSKLEPWKEPYRPTTQLTSTKTVFILLIAAWCGGQSVQKITTKQQYTRETPVTAPINAVNET